MDDSRVNRRLARLSLLATVLWVCSPGLVAAQVCNIKVVTDASPDSLDMTGMIHSTTSRWATPAEKCWVMFYWNHIARRQTSPMIVHGCELTDPIRQFNDYGYTMCSTVAGVNCAIWHNMGLDVRFWDISLHTVSECLYDGRWHVYNNSMSAIYTLCDGVTVAGVEDVGKEGACAASGGGVEPGHIARYHCLNATSADGFLTGADCPRDLSQEVRCFKPSGLKHRHYYHNWDWGHRYILNVKDGESYTRHYYSIGSGPEYFVPNGGKDPEAANARYGIRGNGVWTFEPDLTPGGLERCAQHVANAQAVASGVQPAAADAPAEIVFKIQSADVATSQKIHAVFERKVAVLTSLDGTAYASHGKFELNLRRKDMPINHLLPDEETAQAWNYERILDKPVSARFVKYRLTPRRAVCVTEVQALESIKVEPFDLRIALPNGM